MYSHFCSNLQGRDPHVHFPPFITTIYTPKGCFTPTAFAELLSLIVRLINAETQSIVSRCTDVSTVD
jgi:hypothetical protein